MSAVREDPLLVFGYACQIFRDDVRAMEMERGDHLIPWMGQADLPIGRYDGRGALSDLRIHESQSGREGHDPLLGLETGQLREERACEAERFRSLFEDDLELESAERASTGAAVGYNYDATQTVAVPPPVARPPVQPSLRQLANCIEKTSEFIVAQGAQMEILMRAKEANNPLFQFLNPENPYHSIYQAVYRKKKSRPKNYVANQGLMEQSSLEVEESLKILFSQLNAAPGLVKPKSCNSQNAYSQLVDRIRVNQVANQPPEKKPEPKPEVKPATPPPPVLEHVVEVIPPPISLHPLIDQTASYVAKNGSDALNVVKKHQPEKFSFLNPTDKYHMFFQYKVTLYKEMIASGFRQKPKDGSAKNGRFGSSRGGARVGFGKEHMILDDLGIELAKDSSIVVNQSDEIARNGTQFPLAECESGRDLEWGRPRGRQGLLIELDYSSLNEIPDAVIWILHFTNLFRERLHGGLGQRLFLLVGQIVVHILDHLDRHVGENLEQIRVVAEILKEDVHVFLDGFLHFLSIHRNDEGVDIAESQKNGGRAHGSSLGLIPEGKDPLLIHDQGLGHHVVFIPLEELQPFSGVLEPIILLGHELRELGPLIVHRLVHDQRSGLLDVEVGHVHLHHIHRLENALKEGDDLLGFPQLDNLLVPDRGAELSHQIDDIAGIRLKIQGTILRLLGNELQIQLFMNVLDDTLLLRDQQAQESCLDLLKQVQSLGIHGWIFGELISEQVPKSLMDHLLHLLLQVGFGGFEVLDHKVLVYGNLMGQIHVGDPLSRIHHVP
eukprot:maker-scaffold924_size80766-snap-gene-0.19 protein:Tk12436 transcript:maker-scaffold924_size80766-snap-gene-0.19-mRNA-1 annotation:"protein suppressor of white apricot"